MRNFRVKREGDWRNTAQAAAARERQDMYGMELARHLERECRSMMEKNPEWKSSRTYVTAAIRLLYWALKTEPDPDQAKRGLSRAYATVMDFIEDTGMHLFGRWE